MINRFLSEYLKTAAKQYPVITLTGPRQSGKTTLVKMVFKDYDYVSLEDSDMRTFAQDDPKGFLNRFNKPVILDEAQRVPDLFSYIQTIVDKEDKTGRFILTGSQNFLLLEKISQSLAGRTAIFFLLPFSKRELLNEKPVNPDSFPGINIRDKKYPNVWDLIASGFYPRIHDKNLTAFEWLGNYYQTYIERDVRTLINVGDLDAFGRFIRLCAGRIGQLLNLSSLASDCGISNMTAKRWLSVLQASFIIFLLQPHFENFGKRQIKSPKIYFLDTGLLCYLLGIKKSEDILYHSKKGSIFESFVFSEIYKNYYNHGQLADLYFWNDRQNNEVDFIIERAGKLLPIEVKSGETITSDHLKGLKNYQKLVKRDVIQPVLIYSGNENYIRDGIQLLSWKNI